ncbi:MAG: hypothetical protein ACTSUN_07150 [Promethearchaeota archaeon]
MKEDTDPVDPKDLQSFIDGLKTSLDLLGEADTIESKGFQAQLAKAISNLRMKKVAKIDENRPHIEQFSREELKQFLLEELKALKERIELKDISSRTRYELALEITKLRERISKLYLLGFLAFLVFLI